MAEETETPSYKQNAYPGIDPNSEEFEDICNMWCGEFSPSISEKMEMEGEFLTDSDWPRNVHGFNPNPGRVHPPAAREMLRRPTSNAPCNKSKESLGVVVRRISELMKKENDFGARSGNRTYTDLAIDAFIKMDIGSNHDLNVALYGTRNNPQLARAFQKRLRK